MANVLADAFSMGFGEFIGGSAERDFALRERAREEWEVENCIEVEIEEMIELYATAPAARDELATDEPITRARAIGLIQEVAHAIEQWPLHFAQHGVCAADMEQLAASIDRDALKDQRKAFC